ncbi:Hint domain-containing protein [Accumulibacter sp.]|uniref:Hint domain-containing protein n=1 Tax=Accumulibacter sp. TaxID=2053492 RepID=UPI00262C79C1|nr:Hint domain-containing protein [Accumulibacter sp.]
MRKVLRGFVDDALARTGPLAVEMSGDFPSVRPFARKLHRALLGLDKISEGQNQPYPQPTDRNSQGSTYRRAFAAQTNGATSACFAAGTLVHTRDGLRPIEELQVGDLVTTWPEDKPIPVRPGHPFRPEAEYIYKPITRAFVHADQIVLHVLRLGTGNNDDETLRVAPNYPLFSENHGWVPASQLKISDKLVWADFSNTRICRVREEVERAAVYNVELKDCHRYFVGKMGV